MTMESCQTRPSDAVMPGLQQWVLFGNSTFDVFDADLLCIGAGSICDDESKYHALNSSLPCPDVVCGFHYTSDGWTMIANATASAIRDALASRACSIQS
jgi:hypothetical protein